MGELPKIKKMYVEAEADAIHWRKKYREVQQIRAAERTAAQKTAEELEQAEQREKGLRRDVLIVIEGSLRNEMSHEAKRRLRAALAVPEPAPEPRWPPSENCYCGAGAIRHRYGTGKHCRGKAEPPPEEQP